MKQELESGCDYELMNRHSSDKLLNQIYRRQDSDTMSSKTVTIHDELAEIRDQISNLQRTIELLPERICALLKTQNAVKSSTNCKRHQANLHDDDDDFDNLSSTSVLSDIEILHESIDDNNQELLDWCRRLQLNDITKNIKTEPKQEFLILPKQTHEKPIESNIFSHWERRYSTVTDNPVKPDILFDSTKSNVPKLIPNYSSEVDKNIWLK